MVNQMLGKGSFKMWGEKKKMWGEVKCYISVKCCSNKNFKENF